MKVLITGGAGFIGSNFSRYLLEHRPGMLVVNLDLLTYAGLESNIADLVPRSDYRFVKADVTDRQRLEEVLSWGFDAVVHFAAESHVDRSISGPDPFVTTNVGGTHCLVEACRRVGVRRFIQISSDEVYGSIPAGQQADPESPLNPGNPYAASKAAADLLVQAAVRTYGFPAIITRCTNNYGPWQYPEKFIPLLITRALQGKDLPVYGDGRQVRDWIHVDDHCRALDTILMAGVPGRIYTIAGGCSLENREVARRVLEMAGRPGARVAHVDDRLGHDRRYALDDSALRAELHWSPRIEFEAGLDEVVSWYRNASDWWRPITETEFSSSRIQLKLA